MNRPGMARGGYRFNPTPWRLPMPEFIVPAASCAECSLDWSAWIDLGGEGGGG